jgi:DNA-directed RNA polymerase subunit RPC12/RpoP
MSDFAFIFVFLLVGATIIGIALSKRDEANDQWKSLPFLDEYLAQHPECKTPNGVRCRNCGSKSIKNWGLFNAHSEERKFICNSCGMDLYRK